jgi:hypothetical protein
MEQDEVENSGLVNKVLGVGLLILFVFAIVRYLFGNEVIDSWFQKPGEYTTQYWIYLEPDRKSSKNYRVKGDIDKVSLGDDGYAYYLTTVYWPNGGRSYFSFDECQITSVKGDYCEDIEGRSYTVRLGEKVE